MRGMATGLAVLMTCLSTACGGGNGAESAEPLSFADIGTGAATSVVAAGGNLVMAQAAGGRKSASGVPPGRDRGDGGGSGTSTGGTTTGGTTTTTGGTTTTTDGTSTDALLLAVDLTKIPPPGTGISTLNVAPTDEIAPAGGGAFRIVCPYSHMSFDDPIVYPGQPGRSHLHTFFGNTGTNANSTAESIRNTGNSTCRGGIANRSAYWVPTLIDTRTNAPLKPDNFLAYYKTGALPAASVQPLPTGLRMIAGDPNATGPQSASRWKCLGGPNKQNALYGPTIGNCDVGASLYQEVFFPQCWDGVNLDSPDHRSHMSYPVRVPNADGKGTHAECPKTHPVVLPHITFNVTYVVREQDAPLRWRLSSDLYDRSQPGGLSSHGDWFNGWKTELSDSFARNCIEALKDCHAHLLGDGRKIFY